MKDSSVKFSAVGDITFGDHPLCVGFGAYSKFKGMPSSYPFQHVLDQFKKADILFGNLECALAENEEKWNRLHSAQMRGAPEYVLALVEAGFKILNLANNHSMHHGKEPFLETVKLLEEHGVLYCGVNFEDHSIGRPSIVKSKDIEIAFLGYSLRPRQHFKYDPLYSEGCVAGIEKDVRDVKSRANIAVVSLHWGEEFINRPSPEDIAMARRIIDAGADLIIGHHPHVLRGIEKYKHGVIAYSLGNFVCDMVWDERLRESLIFSCSFTKSGIQEIELIPVYINDNYQPQLLKDEKEKDLLLRIRTLSKELEEEDLSSFEDKCAEYKRDADGVLNQYRNKSHQYFLSHLHHYPIPVLVEQIGTYLKRRIDKFMQRTV